MSPQEPACRTLLDLVERAAAASWSAECESEMVDLENYLSVQLERLEDMEPGAIPEEAKHKLMTAIESLVEMAEEVRVGAESGTLAASAADLRARILEADRAMQGESR